MAKTQDKELPEKKQEKEKDRKRKDRKALVGQVKKVIKKSRRKLGEEKFEKELQRTITFLEQLQMTLGNSQGNGAAAAPKGAPKPAKKPAAKPGPAVKTAGKPVARSK
ncbi:MAG: hypothetical protein ACREEM_41610 [Blastocatellia bacterium]